MPRLRGVVVYYIRFAPLGLNGRFLLCAGGWLSGGMNYAIGMK